MKEETFIFNSRQKLYQFTSSPFIAISISIVTVLSLFRTSIWTPNFSTVQLQRTLYSNYSKEIILSRCSALQLTPSPPLEFCDREQSERFEPGTNPTLIRNAVIFTGDNNGTEIIHGDLLLDKGIIKALGRISKNHIDNMENLTVIDAKGNWVTPGLIDLSSHLGILSLPILSGGIDINSGKGPILPYLRSIDGISTHDLGYELALSGGVTSALISPGSLNAIGGQAFMIKLRKPKDHSSSSMILESPYSLNLSATSDKNSTLRWVHMKQACGENLTKYGNRMDNLWALRSAYNEALKIKISQDEYCAKVENGLWEILDEPFPENIEWDLIVDVLRGKVKVICHCQEAADLDAMIRLSNEFYFRIAAFTSASEAYLVPDVLKQMWGGIPSIAIFATNYRYKREAFRGSEFAGRILADEGIPVIMKSDHPLTNSRYLLYEAQQAHYYGLPPNLALASITSIAAVTAGLDHRIGIIKECRDADVVLWDSHPLRLAATPVKVWIDGILQIPLPSKVDEEHPVVVGRGKESSRWREAPITPNWDKERNQTIIWDGLPPLGGRRIDGRVLFTNVKELWSIEGVEEPLNVIVEKGRISCAGRHCSGNVAHDETLVVDLKGGSMSPGLMSYGSPLGLQEIASEPSTADGESFDAFKGNVPKILDDVGAVVRAVDGLIFGTRDAMTAYRAGVTTATSSLAKPNYIAQEDVHIISGLSTVFRTGSAHAMQEGAIIQDVAALHIVMGKPASRGVSVSTQIATLRRLLYGWESRDKETGYWFRKAAEGIIPFIIEVDSLDIMANLLILKADVEDKIGSRMRMVFSGAAESHLLADEIRNAEIGVILNPSRPFPLVWDQRRILPGPPLTNDTALVTLLEHGILVGIGIRNSWEARNTRFDIQRAALEANGRISKSQALAMVTRNLERLLGIRGIDDGWRDLAVYEGGNMFDTSSKVVGVISPDRKMVELF